MLRKITLRGYNTHVPFKLFYLCDDDGVSDLAEAFKVVLLLPYSGDEELAAMIKLWTLSSYEKELEVINNVRPYYLVGAELEEWTKNEASKKKAIEEELLEISQKLIADMENATSIVVPLSLHKKPQENKLKYLGNKRFSVFKEIRKIEKSIEERYSWGHVSGWALTSIERDKQRLLDFQKWMKRAKLLLNGEVTRHPCMLCTRALEQLEGRCGFGGTHCEDNLGLAISNKLQEVCTDAGAS